MPDMRGAYLAIYTTVVLNFIVFNPCISLYYNFYNLVGKTFLPANGGKGFNYLQVGVLAYMHEAPRLGKGIAEARIRQVIYVNRMFGNLSSFYMNKNSAVYQGGIQGIDAVFYIA